jgi:hypothetical protein
VLLRSSQPASGLSALAPAQRAGAQRLRAMARLGHGATSSASPVSAPNGKFRLRREVGDELHAALGSMCTA